ncbi:Trk system potassium transporter TrkA [Pseudohongiella sp. SYSU M77423]|jgi:trk system potassium uptake protein|uniref:Trk system potassium transporter TrkA n=1 Tax=unclassified Pseudohongiella TaxID=2629611 RepID=UPI000C3F70A6|nr:MULTISPECIES: Trk system potassium transporter TrkA [unclassified Pseudohongiella]MAO40859.1 Trk system potassium transporter TrkA [Pseudohongiella sp.]MAY55122.1 Trk system potassium transporter TrkA [Gammaproteobacteria bacterium]MEC8859708.1 Trk system potassium transporter TrkA [Pseudomonadota bacterium]MBJ55597.1 Trk system potassium transporter TrkA [Gammaproteobacteria bacterium]MDH7944256.1 Trk system potassium transporter TrkA [Pseudohongiella sp. SYSU M77423]|tara:strand:+ start:3462 stop:4835 length:1374 start_codon:yes stop_codon:yes gene_type:complete
MKIIILGCNAVSASLAENLASENTDITLVDPDAEALRELKDRLDIGIAQGWPSHPDVLRAAGADDADMIIAVTENDEINMVACQIAFSVFKTPKKICRLRSASYIAQDDLFRPDAIPLDVVISPELLVSNYIRRLIELPGSLQVLDFADGNAQLVAVRAYYGGPLVGQEIRFLREHMPNVDARVAAIFRRNRAITPEGSTVIEADDEVFFIAAPKNIKAVISELRRMDRPYKRLIIAGGGNIGARLASALEERYQVKVIEHNPDRCAYLSEFLNRAVVLNGISSDKKLLQEEGIADTDVFLALTNDDEANIMSSLLAKRLGARKVMCLISNPAYVDLVQGGEIDIAISPQQASIGSLLTHIRKGDIVNVHSLRRGAAEALEAIAHGDSQSSKVVGRAIEDIDLPQGTTIGAIVRDEEVLIAHDDIVIEPEDHVILFLTDKKRIPEVERLFAVGFAFF